MISLGKLFSSYTGSLRQFKLVYSINNILNRKKLEHNKTLYSKYGVKKSIYSPIGSHNFQPRSPQIPWLDQENALEALLNHRSYASFSERFQEKLRQFVEEGYMLLEGFFDDAQVDKVNAEIQELLENKAIAFNYTGKKVMESYKHSEAVNECFRHGQLLKVLSFLMGKKVIPFQTINFIEGSEQRAHSDSIHMSTEPQGYLIATWTALEDIQEGSGPLFYYPKSHRLPYITCMDYPSGNTKYLIGRESNKRYEDKIEEVVQKAGLERKIFYGKKGDVFIWHANLLHGGLGISKEGTTRKSLVAHYFCKDAICYHEISQRPALLDL